MVLVGVYFHFVSQLAELQAELQSLRSTAGDVPDDVVSDAAVHHSYPEHHTRYLWTTPILSTSCDDASSSSSASSDANIGAQCPWMPDLTDSALQFLNDFETEIYQELPFLERL